MLLLYHSYRLFPPKNLAWLLPKRSSTIASQAVLSNAFTSSLLHAAKIDTVPGKLLPHEHYPVLPAPILVPWNGA